MIQQHSNPENGSEWIETADIEQAAVIAFNPEQLESLKVAVRERASRAGLEHLGINVLIVEDQEFSRQLIRSVFTRQQYDFIFHVAKTASEAIHKYAEIAPDVVYLDIELPDGNGHELAALFTQHDPDTFIYMVTANNYPKDVETAISNKVKGFVAKPFSKQKIMQAIDSYFKLKKRHRRVLICTNPLI